MFPLEILISERDIWDPLKRRFRLKIKPYLEKFLKKDKKPSREFFLRGEYSLECLPRFDYSFNDIYRDSHVTFVLVIRNLFGLWKASIAVIGFKRSERSGAILVEQIQGVRGDVEP